MRCLILWRTGNGLNDENGKIVILVTQFLMFGLRMATFIANIAKIYTSYKFIRPVCEKTHEHILMSCVDDVTVSSRTAADRDRMVNICTAGLRLGNFRWKGWIHNRSNKDDAGLIVARV